MNLAAQCEELARAARMASRRLAGASAQQKNDWLVASADALESRMEEVLRANQRDLDAAPGYDLNPAQIDRLRLTSERVRAAARGLREIGALPDPVGKLLDRTVRPNGLEVRKV